MVSVECATATDCFQQDMNHMTMSFDALANHFPMLDSCTVNFPVHLPNHSMLNSAQDSSTTNSLCSMEDLTMLNCLAATMLRDDGNYCDSHCAMIDCSMIMGNRIVSTMDILRSNRLTMNVRIGLGNWWCQCWTIIDEHFDVYANEPVYSKTTLVRELQWV